MIEMDEMKGRGKRGLLRVVFGRTMFFLLFIALQLAFLFWIYVLLDNKRNREHAALAGFLLGDLQAVSVPVSDNITGPQLQYVADPQA